MKISPAKRRRREQGYLLLVTLSLALILGLTVGGYLLVINQEDQTVVRSQCWNSALAVAEAGVDEALAQMNASVYKFSANGWNPTGSTFSPNPPPRTLANGSSYTVSIDTSGTLPTIYSTGTVVVPYVSQPVFRAVVVTALRQYFFNIGVGAVSNITMNGNGNSFITDSWNSETNTLSTNGQYSPSMISTNGDVASEWGIVDFGNHTIDGNMYLGPTANYTSGPNGGVTNGTIYYDNNIQYPLVSLPTTDTNGNSISWLPATTFGGTNIFGTGSGTNFSYLSGYYYVSNPSPIYVAPGQTVTLQVETTTFDFSHLTIDGGTANAGTLIVHQDSGAATLSGNGSSGGAVSNRPENFMYFGLSNVTSITGFKGNGTFVGAIYAPQASATLDGGGSAFNFEGSLVVHDLTLNGHFDVHYDEALANKGPIKGYYANSWQEIPLH